MDEQTAARLVDSHIGDLRRQAERDGLVRAARAAVRGGDQLGPRRPGPRRPAMRPYGVPLAAGGLVAVVLATLGLLPGGPSGGRRATSPSPPAAPVSSLTVDAPSGVEVERVTYRPGQASSWHMHTGLHAVAVLSGTLTVYDGACEAHIYGPGDSYVGGTTEHMASNATDGPVDMVVTYIFPEGSSMANFVVPMPPPAACGEVFTSNG